MHVTTKPNEQHGRGQIDFTWEQFAKDCLLNKYALVVGSEVILNREVYPEANGNSTQFLFDKTLYSIATNEIEAEYCDNGQPVPENEILEEYHHLKRRYKNFTQLDRKYKDVKKQVLKSTHRLMENKDGFVNSIDPSLLQLLKTRCFRIVITTAIDPLLELAMEEVWGYHGFDVIQIENAKQAFNTVTYDEFNVNRPILCYMFGKIDTSNSLEKNRFVLSENQAIEKIAKWFDSVEQNGFLKYLRNYSIFSVGPQFSDWMFRFFWYLLRGEIGKNSGNQQVVVEIKNEDPNLVNYLEMENVRVFLDAREFMGYAIDQINKALPLLTEPRRDQGVFISYSHKDRYIAMPLFERLRAENIPVWIDDEKLDDGDEFKDRITNAINTCRLFLPILSTSIREQITTGTIKQQWYYENEWSLIDKRYNNEEKKHEEIRETNENSHPQHSFRTVPFIVGDYNYSKEYHQELPSCIKNASINDTFTLAKDRIEHLIQIIQNK